MAIVPVILPNPSPPELDVVLWVQVALRVHDAADDFLIREAGGVDGGDEWKVGEDGRADCHFLCYAEGEIVGKCSAR